MSASQIIICRNVTIIRKTLGEHGLVNHTTNGRETEGMKGSDDQRKWQRGDHIGLVEAALR